MIAAIATIGVLISLGLALTRLFAGPTLYDRVLAFNAATLQAAIIIGALAVATGRGEWIDVALVSAIGAFVVNVAVLKFFRARTFQPPLVRAEEDAA